MKIRLHEAAFQDLTEGFEFYERQERNLGAYFLDSLFSDVDSLLIYAGVHPIFFKAYSGCCQNGFRLQSTIVSTVMT